MASYFVQEYYVSAWENLMYMYIVKFLNTVQMKLCNLKCLHDHSFYNKNDQSISHKFTVFTTDSEIGYMSK